MDTQLRICARHAEYARLSQAWCMAIVTYAHTRNPLTALTAADDMLSGHGVETIWQGKDKPSCLYINRGDTYTDTLLWDDWREQFCITSWGDWFERQEAEGHTYD